MKWAVVALASVLVIGGALALLVTVGPLSSIASSIQADLDGASAQRLQFSGEVETLGLDQFPQIFADATVNADGSVSIYCTQVTPALRTAVANADTDGAKYSFMIVPHIAVITACQYCTPPATTGCHVALKSPGTQQKHSGIIAIAAYSMLCCDKNSTIRSQRKFATSCDHIAALYAVQIGQAPPDDPPFMLHQKVVS